MKKAFGKIVIVALIILFPLASWYYLDTGLNFRKKALRELTPKGLWVLSNSVGENRLNGYTTVAYDDQISKSHIDALMQQFGKAPSFQLLKILPDSSSIDETINSVVISEKKLSDIFRTGKQIYLIDTSMQLRYSYIYDQDQMKKLVEHIAIVLPRAQDPDIKMINRKNEGE